MGSWTSSGPLGASISTTELDAEAVTFAKLSSTDARGMHIITEVDQGAADPTFSSGTIDCSNFKVIKVYASIEMAAQNPVKLILNGDTTAANYDGQYVYFSADTHGALANNNNISIINGGAGNVVRWIELTIYNFNYSSNGRFYWSIAGQGDGGDAAAMAGRHTGTSALTNISLYGDGATNITTASTMVIVGIVGG